MKKFLLLVLVCVMGTTGYSQLGSGTKLEKNLKTTDIKGKEVDLFADLDAGKTVVLDVFATWCGPCWGYHESGFLKNIHKELGPEGTDQVRVYAIEADSRTSVEYLTTTHDQFNPFGDWTKDVDYSIVNSDEAFSIFSIRYFPTIYIIRPNRTVYLVRGAGVVDKEKWLKIINQEATYPNLISNVPDATFCTEAEVSYASEIENLGNTKMETVTIEAAYGDKKVTKQFTVNLEELQVGEIKLDKEVVQEDTKVDVRIVKVNGKDFSEGAGKSGSIIKPTLTSNTFTVKFTTDYFPGETSWKLTDDLGNTLKEVSYTGTDNGGGENSSKTFTYEIEVVDPKATCLSLEISDSYEDGLTAHLSGKPQPGVEIIANGEVIKPVFRSDADFTSKNTISVSVDLVSSTKETEFKGEFEIAPNPVSAVANIDFSLDQSAEVVLEISDITGKVIDRKYLGTMQGSNRYAYDVSALNNGMYLFAITAGSQKTMRKVSVLK